MESYSLGQRAFAEALGTALLVLVGPGSVVATLVLAGDSTPAITGADLLGISFAFGLIITALVYALGKVSGCHINPAVTFALAATKRFPWREVPPYWGAQVVGAVLGALGIWAIFASTAIDLGMGQTSFNEDTATWAQAIFAEGIGTFMLMFAILGIVDSKSPSDLAGIVIGGVVVAIIMVIGPMTGASLNPARAFGPELVSTFGGGVTHWGQHIPVYLLPGLVGPASRRSRTTSWPSRAGRRGRSRPRSRRPTASAAASERTDMATVTNTMRKLLNDPEQVVKDSLVGLEAAHGDILRVDAEAQIVVRAGAPALRQGGARSPAAARATSRCTAASSGSACSTRRAPARSSPRRCPTRCSPRRRPSTAAPASCTSSRTTRATS